MPARGRVTALLALLFLLLPVSAGATEEISVQLKWRHAFQFAGIYMAKEKGFYSEHGLNVTLIEGGPGKSSIDFVTQGPGRYGIADTGALLARADGKPVKALASIFQQSPLALVVLKSSGIRSFADLRGKRVMLQQGTLNADIIAAMDKAGVREGDFIRQEISYDIDDLVQGNTDAYAIYVTDQPHQLKARGIPFRILHPKDLGIEFYGDTLITSDSEIASHPERANAFIKATVDGWIYALDHIDETVELILSSYNTQHFSSDQLYFEARETSKIVLKELVTLGYMSNYRWQQIAKVYAGLGLMPADYPVEQFLYQPAPGFGALFDHYKWQLLSAGLVLLLVVMALISFVLRKLVLSRTARLRKSEVMQASISEILQMIAESKSLTAIFEAIIGVYESIYPGMRASILLIENNRLYNGSAPNLPDAYNRVVEGLEIGPMVGSCGSAAFLKQRVIVGDIASDPRWAPFKELALGHDLRACWSEPILTQTGEVLGTFGMYYDHPREPSQEEIRHISSAAKIAGIAIERNRSIDELRKFSRAIDQLAEGIYITGRDGIIEYINPAFTSITGYAPEDAIGMVSRPFDAHGQAGYEGTVECVEKGQVWQGRTEERRKDGSVFPAMVSVSPVRNDRDEILHFIGVLEDLTKLQTLETQFQQAQKMEAIGTLVGGIAHDFNNMLAGILGNLYLLRTEATSQPGVLDKVDRIEALSERAAEMIRQLLAFANKVTIEKQPLALSSFLGEAIKLHRIIIPESVELEVHIEPGLFVSADATQIQQVLVNMMHNARDAVTGTQHPRIRITLERFRGDDAFIERHAPGTSTRDYACLSIVDNGHGISPELIQHIYEPFFTTKEIGKGTGLGLSMVFGSVRSHDGTIDVESSVDKGTAFHIYLPLIESSEKDFEKTQEQSLIRYGHQETILLVDDDELLLQANAEVIDALGYRVLTAVNGLEAIEMFAARPEKIDLVILDLVMPKLGGRDAAKEIRKIRPEARIIFSTGYDMDESMSQHDLANDFLLKKPFTVKALSKVLEKALAG